MSDVLLWMFDHGPVVLAGFALGAAAILVVALFGEPPHVS